MGHPAEAEQGFMLLGLIVAVALILLTLSVAAPIVAKNLRRDREVEAVHRGNQYVRAIQLYYKKFGHYPGSMEQLEHTNNIRFLRKRYVDPITGKDDWRVIAPGSNQTTVKWFFGEPLTGLASGGVGSVAGMLSQGISAPATGTTAATSVGANGVAAGAGGVGATATAGTAAAAAAGTTGTPDPTAASATTPGALGSQSASTFSGTGTPFIGVGLDATGASIVEVNEMKSYDSWEFLYDPRLDQMKAKALAANGGGLSGGSLGTGSLGTGALPTGAAGTTPAGSAGTTVGAPVAQPQ